MNTATLKAKACGYLNRAAADLVVNGIDLILDAANSAKKTAQKLLDFEYLKTQVQVTVSLTTGGSLATAVVYGGGAAVSVNKIVSAWALVNGSSRPIEVVSKQTMQRRLGANWNMQYTWEDWARASGAQVVLPSDTPVLVREGDALILWPNTTAIFGSTSVTVGMDVIKWAPDYNSTNTVTVTYTGSNGGVLTTGSHVLTNIGIVNGENIYFQSTDDYTLFYDSTSGYWSFDNQPAVHGNYFRALIAGRSALVSTTWGSQGFVANGTFTVSGFASTGVVDNDIFSNENEDWLLWAVLKNLHYFIKDEKRSAEIHRLYGEAWDSMRAWNEGIGVSQTDDDLDLD